MSVERGAGNSLVGESDLPWVGEFDRLLIDGEWTAAASNEWIDVLSPWSESTLAAVPHGSLDDIDRAVAAARRTFDEGPWRRMSLSERAVVLTIVRDLLEQNSELIAQLVTAELGAPIAQSRAVQAAMPVAIADMNLAVATEFEFESIRTASSGSALVSMDAVGVVAAVIPWNGPVAACVLKLFPALLAGCSVVLKPSLETPLGAYFVADLMVQAGLPAGALNVVPAGPEASEHLVTHRDVDMVTFTGSSSVGRHIAGLCAREFKRNTLELGGKSAAVILDDADIDIVTSSLRMGSLRNSGQVCSLKTRILVSERRHDEVVDRLADMMTSMEVGSPYSEATEIGPMVSRAQQHRVANYQAIGVSEGAKAVVGGRGTHPDFDRGYFVDPTLLDGVTPDMRVAKEEIFGPVVSVITYKDVDDAVRIANDSEYGLSGAVFSEDFGSAMSVARRIRTGTVEINGGSTGVFAPAGGVKASGVGREYGPEGLAEFVEPKSYGVRADQLHMLKR